MHLADHVIAAVVLLADQPGVTDETLAFNGAAELDGRFEIYSGAADDTIVGGAGNDKIYGAAVVLLAAIAASLFFWKP